MSIMILRTRGTGGMTAVGRHVASCPIMEDCRMKNKDIEIKRYDIRAVTVNGQVITKYFAIGLDDEEYEMPPAFKEGYTDDYLKIRPMTSEMPEVLDLPEGEFYIPIRTKPLDPVKVKKR